MNENKNLIYKNYISTTHFDKIRKKSIKNLSIFYNYYKKNYLKHLPDDKSKRILDVGCGMGQFLYFLKKEGYNNHMGVDTSKECIEYCQKNNFNVKHNDVIEFLTTNKILFDCIIMYDLIEHFKKEKVIDLLNLIRKNLKVGGKVIIKTPNMANPLLGLHGRYIDFSHEIGFTEESLSQALKISTFKKIKILPQNIYIFYYNPLNYIAWFISKLINFIFKLLFLIYGRKNTKIFTKKIIAIAYK